MLPGFVELTCGIASTQGKQNLLAVLLAGLDTSGDNIAASEELAVCAIRVREGHASTSVT
jgi:hypothetical protein